MAQNVSEQSPALPFLPPPDIPTYSAPPCHLPLPLCFKFLKHAFCSVWLLSCFTHPLVPRLKRIIGPPRPKPCFNF